MNYIKGIGIDVAKVSRFKRLLEQKHLQNFLNKALHVSEIKELNLLKSDEAKAKYLASRWSYKESLVKATGDKTIVFSKVFLEKNIDGKPYINFDIDYLESNEKLKESVSKIHVSISHEDDIATSIVILENCNNMI